MAREDWQEEARDQLGEQVGRAVSPEDFLGWLGVKASRGAEQGMLLKYCMIAVNALHDDADRWVRLESPGEQTSAVWLKASEAEIVVKALRSDRSSVARLVRQSIRDRFPHD